MATNYSLRAGRYKKVGGWSGTSQRTLHMEVATGRTCRFRKKALSLLVTSSGSFVRQRNVRLFNQTVEVKSPVDTTCTTWFIS